MSYFSEPTDYSWLRIFLLLCFYLKQASLIVSSSLEEFPAKVSVQVSGCHSDSYSDLQGGSGNFSLYFSLDKDKWGPNRERVEVNIWILVWNLITAVLTLPTICIPKPFNLKLRNEGFISWSPQAIVCAKSLSF